MKYCEIATEIASSKMNSYNKNEVISSQQLIVHSKYYYYYYFACTIVGLYTTGIKRSSTFLNISHIIWAGMLHTPWPLYKPELWLFHCSYILVLARIHTIFSIIALLNFWQNNCNRGISVKRQHFLICLQNSLVLYEEQPFWASPNSRSSCSFIEKIVLFPSIYLNSVNVNKSSLIL